MHTLSAVRTPRQCEAGAADLHGAHDAGKINRRLSSAVHIWKEQGQKLLLHPLLWRI